MKLSVVIPVYNSAGYLKNTVDVTFHALDGVVDELEIILIDDNSPDNVWTIIRELAAIDGRVKGVRLAKNYGQHSAIFVGLKIATGDCIATIDDDLQNPPGEIPKLLEAIQSGHDLAVGAFTSKAHNKVRNIGSKLMHRIVSKIFQSEVKFSHTNFRVMTRDVANRITAFQGMFPYINGLAFYNSTKPINVEVRHDQRLDGKSNYTLGALFRLGSRVLLGFSTIPIKLISVFGIFFSLVSFVVGLYALIANLFGDGPLAGWSSIIVLMSFSNGLIFITLILITNLVHRIGQSTESTVRFLIDDKTPALK